MTEVICSQIECKFNSEKGICTAMKLYLNNCVESVSCVCLNYAQDEEKSDVLKQNKEDEILYRLEREM